MKSRFTSAPPPSCGQKQKRGTGEPTHVATQISIDLVRSTVRETARSIAAEAASRHRPERPDAAQPPISSGTSWIEMRMTRAIRTMNPVR